MGDRKGRPYSQSPNTVRSTVRADVGIGPYGALLHLFVGRDAHAVERSGTSIPLGCIAPPYSDVGFTVAPHERQRRKRKVDASYKAIMTMFRERVV